MIVEKDEERKVNAAGTLKKRKVGRNLDEILRRDER